ncbi:hypothetical protein PO909_027235 [Leuciscus waleckii]
MHEVFVVRPRSKIMWFLCSLDSHLSSRCWRLWTALKRSSSSFRLSITVSSWNVRSWPARRQRCSDTISWVFG